MSRARFSQQVAASFGLSAALLIAGTACGSDSGGGASGSKDTVTVMVMAPETGSGANFPDVQTAAEAYAKHVNDTGGINGRKLAVDFCDEKGDPNGAAKCARKAVADK